MENMFSIGELAKYQKISKQTLIFYDKIGLFRPAYVDEHNGYRYYSAQQLDYLDSILIMKKSGFSLEEIRRHMKSYTTSESLQFLRQQSEVIDKKIQELRLIKSRLSHRCEQVERALGMQDARPEREQAQECFILYAPVLKPYGMRETSIATKQCYAQALSDSLPVFYQCGVSVPLKRVLSGRCTEASLAFLTTESTSLAENILRLPPGLTVSACHFGNYESISSAYSSILQFCREQGLSIISDSYEFCLNDYITSRYEEEFITKIMFYVKENK